MNPIPWYKSNVMRSLLVASVAFALQRAGLANQFPDAGAIVDLLLSIMTGGGIAAAGISRATQPTPPLTITQDAADRRQARMPLGVVLLCLLLMHLLIAPAVFAVDARITCTAATTYTDNTPIPPGTVSTFSLYGGKQGATKQKLVSNAAKCDFERKNLDVGTHEWYVTQTTGGLESLPSTMLVKSGQPPDQDGDGVPDATDACPTVKGTLPNGCNVSPPKAPQAFIDVPVAYELQQNAEGLIFAMPVGRVPRGAVCGVESVELAGVVYTRIESALVDLSTLPEREPFNAYAICSAG